MMKTDKICTSLLHTGKEHIINAHQIKECDEPVENRDIINNISMEQEMSKDTDIEVNMESNNGLKVILRFPDKSELEETDIYDVKKIMNSLLQEQIAHCV